MRAAFAPLLALALFAPEAAAQASGDSSRTAALSGASPEAERVVVREGTGRRFVLRQRWREAPAAPRPPVDRAALARIVQEELARLDAGGATPEAEGADLLRIELALARLDDRLDELAALLLLPPEERRRAADDLLGPLVLRPGLAPPEAEPSPLAPADRPVPPRPEAPPPIAVVPPPPPIAPPPEAPGAVDLGAVDVATVERAILETGLFRTSRVPFAFGEATLLPEAQRVLSAVADVLLRYPALRVQVGGHTDAVSSDAFNLRLSQARAASVRDYLVASGVAAGRLEAVGYGEAVPIAENETETGRALNRRVEFVVLNPEAAVQEIRTEQPADADLRQRLREALRREMEREED